MSMVLGEISVKVTADTSELDSGMSKAASTIDSFGSKINAATSSMQTVGAGMAAVGAAGAVMFGSAVNSAADFEFQMDAVNAALGGVPQDVFTGLSDQALELGASTQFSAGEIAATQEALAKAGVSAEDLLNGATQAVADLSSATGEGPLPSAASSSSSSSSESRRRMVRAIFSGSRGTVIVRGRKPAWTAAAWAEISPLRTRWARSGLSRFRRRTAYVLSFCVGFVLQSPLVY